MIGDSQLRLETKVDLLLISQVTKKLSLYSSKLLTGLDLFRDKKLRSLLMQRLLNFMKTESIG